MNINDMGKCHCRRSLEDVYPVKDICSGCGREERFCICDPLKELPEEHPIKRRSIFGFFLILTILANFDNITLALLHTLNLIPVVILAYLGSILDIRFFSFLMNLIRR